jgi:hypothetical protein
MGSQGHPDGQELFYSRYLRSLPATGLGLPRKSEGKSWADSFQHPNIAPTGDKNKSGHLTLSKSMNEGRK